MAGRRLQGSAVLITGAGSGIGRLMALGAAQRGAALVLWDLSKERVENVRREIAATGARASACVVDVSDHDAVQAAAAAVLEQDGPVDVLVNNAGVVSGRPLTETSRAAVERTYGVNTFALYWTTKAFLPSMIERRRGRVVTIASAAGIIGVAQQTDYSASKHAAVGFDEALRQEMRQLRTGVITTIVCPYYIDTGMFAGVRTRFPLLLPILKEQEVASAVLDAVEAGRPRLVLPRLVGLLPAMRLLPVGLFDRIADLLGVNSTMEHFTGREGDRVAGPPATLPSGSEPATAGLSAGEPVDGRG